MGGLDRHCTAHLTSLTWLLLVAVLPAGTIEVRLKQPGSKANHRQGIVCDLMMVEARTNLLVQTRQTSSGEASFRELDPGTYRLRAHRRSGYTLSSNIVVTAGKPTFVDFVVPAPKQPVVETFRTHTQLSSSKIRQLAESHDGTMWATSHIGLMAFVDGRWTPHSLAGVAVYEVAANGEDLLAYTRRGIFKISLEHAPVLISEPGERFRESATHRLGVREDGAILFSIGTNLVFQQEGQRHHLTLPQSVIRILACADKRFIILTSHAIWQWREDQDSPIKLFEDADLLIRSMALDQHGDCLVYARRGSEGILLASHNGVWREHHKVPLQFGMGPWGMTMNNGVLWISGARTLTRIMDGRAVKISVPVFSKSTGRQDPLALLATSNTVWAGGREGIHRVHEGQKYIHSHGTGLAGQRPRSLAKDAQGHLWAVSHDTVNVYEDGEWRKFSGIPTVEPHNYQRHRPQVHCLGDRVFIATWKGLFEVEDGALGQSNIPEALRRSPIGHLGPAPGGISASSGNQLFRFNAARTSWHAEAAIPADLMPEVLHMWIDPDNKVWASGDMETACLENGTWALKNLKDLETGEPRFPPVYAADGSTWTSMQDKCFRGTAEGTSPVFFVEATAVNNIRESAIGPLVSTSNGLYVFRKKNRWKLGKADGLPSKIVYDALLDGDRLWISTALGLVELHQAPKAPRAPKIKILTDDAVSTQPVRFMVTSENDSATISFVTGIHHSEPAPTIDETTNWERIPKGGVDQYLSSRTGKHRLYAYTENALGQRSPVTEQSVGLIAAPIQFARRVRNGITIGLGLLLIALTAWGWGRQRNLLRREASARRAAEAAAEEASQANLAKSRFLANVSHELRTPLTSVIGYGDLIAMDKEAPEGMRESALAIQRGGRHLLSVVNNVITLSQIESGGTLIEAEPTSVNSLLKEIYEQLKFLAANKQLAFQTELDPATPRLINVDAGKLRQILLNLVANAIKYTEEGSVTLRCRSEEARIRFEVEDSGPGISDELRKDLFSPFARAREHIKIEGAGLGLALSKALAEAMNGQLSLTSSQETGSTFSLWIPLVEASFAGLEKETVAAVTPMADPESRNADVSGNVLIVDDESPNRKLFTKMVRDLNLDVRTAEDGRSAVEISRGWRPDLILMDLRLPDISGEQAAQMVLEHWVEDPPWITCISADVFGFDRDSETSPFDDYLNKPIRKKALTTHILEVLSREKNAADESGDPA